MGRIGIACDCHNTLINSNNAWINAFVDFVGEEKRNDITFSLYGKQKRRELARKYKVNFSLIEERADVYEKKNEKIINMLNAARNMGIPLFVVSNAPSRRVLKDMKITGIIDMFSRVYTGNDGGKSNLAIYNQILNEYHLDYLIFLGNEEFDDHIHHDKVISFALTSFLRERCDIINGYQVDKNGKVKNTQNDGVRKKEL